MKIVNLTPHEINAYTSSSDSLFRTIMPSGIVTRISSKNEKVGEFDGIPLFKTVFGETVDLPSPEKGTIYIVSALVLEANRDREDLYAPGDLKRNDKGQPIGCVGLRR